MEAGEQATRPRKLTQCEEEIFVSNKQIVKFHRLLMVQNICITRRTSGLQEKEGQKVNICCNDKYLPLCCLVSFIFLLIMSPV